MDIGEVKARYDALGAIEELAGERTWVGRLWTWESFLGYGPAVADDLRRARAGGESWRGLHPALHDLVLEAFPPRGRSGR